MSDYHLRQNTTTPLPPRVAEQYTADDGTIAIPVANNLNLFSVETVVNNDNGIQSTANPNGSDNFYYQLTNRQTGQLTIVNDNTYQTINTILMNDGLVPPLSNPGTYQVRGNVQAFVDTVPLDPDTPASAGFEFGGVFRTTGNAGTGTLLTTFTHNTYQDNIFVAGNADIRLSVDVPGNAILLEVRSLGTYTVVWNTLMEYRRTP